MKVRKLAVALALAGGLGSGVAQALGLGEIELQSYLNEPLDAEIALTQSRGISPGDVFVNIAPQSAYERVGLSRNQFLSKLRFEVVTGSDGNLVVNVSSREPLREPYLNFLLELTWPSGRLMREYAVLVDPPVYAERSGLAESVSAPSVAETAPAVRPRSQESVRRQAAAEGSLSSGYSRSTIGPTGPSDTLWTIASRVRPNDSVSMQQVMLAIQDLNPDAFMGGNINRLKRGEVLRVPSLEDIQRRSRAEAVRQVARQNEAFEASRRTVDATATGRSAPAPTATTGGEAELKLLVADNEGGRDAQEGGSAGGDSQLPGGVDAGTAVVMEELESARRENAELNSRLEDLQDQVETLQRLLELKNSQLADLQRMAGDQAATDAAGEMPATPETPDATTMAADAAMPAEGDAGEGAEPGAPAEPAADAMAADVTMAPEESSAPESAGDAGTDMATGNKAEPADAGGKTEPMEAAEPQAASAPSSDAGEPAPAAEPAKPAAPAPKPAAEKGFPANVIDLIVSNPMYQIALGGGLIVLLLLLLLLARRNANREKAFYEQLNNEPADESDTFDLTLDEEAPEAAENPRDALDEADSYVAFGQLEQAAQVLEEAISREPSRTDLRLKLLGIYADSQDRESFEKQLGEIEALDDEDALEQANALKARLEEAESMPSIDDLESELRSDAFASGEDRGFGAETPAEPLSDELLADTFEAGSEEELENEFGEFASDEALIDQGDQEEESLAEDDLGIDFELDETGEDDGSTDLELPEEELAALESFDLPEEESGDKELELPADDDLTLDLEDMEATDGGDDTGSLESELEGLDESFLDELDAELDKAADEDEALADAASEESPLDELELDVSDEDLALMEEFSEVSEDESSEVPAAEDPSLDEELGLEDALETSGDEIPEDEVPVASEAIDSVPSTPEAVPDIDEEALGDEDDFSFLAGTDEAATKLDLARAYIEMGDSEGARDILEEVALEGNEEQKAEAQDLLKNLS
jgi:pilus assembly protein FimV